MSQSGWKERPGGRGLRGSMWGGGGTRSDRRAADYMGIRGLRGLGLCCWMRQETTRSAEQKSNSFKPPSFE